MENEFRGKRILVTGATGFIGSHLLKRLCNGRSDVSILVKRNPPALTISHLGITTYKASITDPGIASIIEKAKPDIVFHLAASLRKDNSQESLDENMAVNFSGTLNLLNAFAGKGIERFVFVSTSEGYEGTPPFSEEHRRTPISSYSLSKMCAENLCEYFSKTQKIPITILRPFIVYGPGQGKGMLIPDVILSLIEGNSPKTTKGEQTRDFVYVGDVIDALLLTCMKKEATGQTYNVCTGTEHKIKDIIKNLGALVGGESKPDIGAIPYRENETWRHFGDNRKLMSLGWEPKTGIEDGLKKTVKWYKNHAME